MSKIARPAIVVADVNGGGSGGGGGGGIGDFDMAFKFDLEDDAMMPEGFDLNDYNIPSSAYGKVTLGYGDRVKTIQRLNSSGSTLKSIGKVVAPNATIVKYYAFSYLENLSECILPKCECIEPYAFNNCTKLERIDLPECTEIQANAFNSCSKLSSISMPKCETLGGGRGYTSGVFGYCDMLTSLDMPSVKTLRQGALGQLPATCHRILLPSIETIGATAFYGPNADTLYIWLGPNLTTVDSNAFGNIVDQYNSKRLIIDCAFSQDHLAITVPGSDGIDASRCQINYNIMAPRQTPSSIENVS